MTPDDQIHDALDAMGVRIEYAALPADRDGEYVHQRKLIRLRHGMTNRLHRSVLTHECAHAVFGDEPSMFGPLNAKQERRADEWAAMRLIRHEDYRNSEAIHHGHAGAMAHDLGVVRSIVEAYQRILLRVGDTVYIAPKMGAGMWAHREEIA
ncbi:ImmA/IrrE family metallo-endopeptidase [Microbacterium plantarum]|uniref:ImmA/IrrE family metallo-endopeptidase n=1 Tax=Microbacterium plantarum TaxID=1816425 RepID=UPI002B49D184|nr:ImmA/IrrE family metallo-endopeptidase [Microbacterium plantarum]WRK16158.1 ImmA/IrrE family metallo-endopeptidase [Microbacterium plantarum]